MACGREGRGRAVLLVDVRISCWFGYSSLAGSLCDMSLDLFQSIGLSEAKAKETLKNVTVSATLESIIRKVRKHCHDCVIFVSTCRDSLSG